MGEIGAFANRSRAYACRALDGKIHVPGGRFETIEHNTDLA
jgi:hypothetical protein